MSGIALTIDASQLAQVREEATALGLDLQGDPLKRVAGESIRDTVAVYLAEISRDAEHHQWASALGATRTGFYEEASVAAAQASITTDPDGVTVSIDHEGLAQRLFGGTIAARPGGYLTIPARAEAYGHRAGEFSNLQFVLFGDTGLAALVEKGAPGDEGSVFYWLVRSVTQAPDRTVLPTEEAMVDPAAEAVRNYVEVLWERKKAA